MLVGIVVVRRVVGVPTLVNVDLETLVALLAPAVQSVLTQGLTHAERAASSLLSRPGEPNVASQRAPRGPHDHRLRPPLLKRSCDGPALAFNSTVASRGHPAGIRAARAAGHGKVTAGNNPNFM